MAAFVFDVIEADQPQADGSTARLFRASSAAGLCLVLAGWSSRPFVLFFRPPARLTVFFSFLFFSFLFVGDGCFVL